MLFNDSWCFRWGAELDNPCKGMRLGGGGKVLCPRPQEYISNPLLIEGKKFDMRVYVLVTSVRHLSMFIYDEVACGSPSTTMLD